MKREGLFRLWQAEQEEHRPLAWFSVEEMAEGAALDGKTVYLDALLRDFENDKTALRQALAALPESYANTFRYGEEDAVTLPPSPAEPLLRGRSGNEKALACAPFSTEECLLLRGLAAHAKDLPLKNVPRGVEPLPYHWLRVENSELRTALAALAAKLKEAGFALLEVEGMRYFRLSMPPEAIFSSGFRYGFTGLSGTRPSLVLTLPGVQTPLGEVGTVRESVEVTKQIAVKLEALRHGDERTQPRNIQDDNERLRDSLRRIKTLKETEERLGMRGFLRTRNSEYVITCTWRLPNDPDADIIKET